MSFAVSALALPATSRGARRTDILRFSREPLQHKRDGQRPLRLVVAFARVGGWVARFSGSPVVARSSRIAAATRVVFLHVKWGYQGGGAMAFALVGGLRRQDFTTHSCGHTPV